jgi:hypothetical protein
MEDIIPMELIKTTRHELGVTALPRSSRTVMDSADFNNAKNGDVEAAARMVDKLWGAEQTRELAARLDPNKETVFIPVPSTSGKNKIPDALGLKLEQELGGKFVDIRFQVGAKTPMKSIPPRDRPFSMREYTAETPEVSRRLIGKQVVVVEDVLTTGGSARQFVNTLRKEGIDVNSIAGLMGDARLDAPPQLLSKLQATLRNSGMDVKGRDLAEVLSKGEIQVIINRINKAGKYERTELAARLQGLLDSRTAQRMGEHPEQQIHGAAANRGRNAESTGNAQPVERVPPRAGELGFLE